ncbi:MAG: DUF2796 domain-containing protein [Gemmatimonas sp.]|jgi:hypothetical protein|uniref:ZrgA family zinc uptake protein n=1 Tax=Gemmatimonas sp. TaxID=1962908 RepID=UPI0022C95CF4|nr:DUF2796 domain-containing protein [Gemmatimonas sp.]MCA2984706.1 DUF2796 domain-containing protein [Gemmatimonas sp.]MCA2985969.1 DUF2796 domain-containing protein [Gemmatimonas sp.]MCA2995813.1 DUF2796 domain-containing protein [Gemmatimonas sp.]MCE2953822.1 DUF2796 domain-containing protein [Gemmatimonas sp.]MCZ8013578.1 DUF2796 domain-containing protein [Gemmatimonas sp.]
MTRAPRRGRFAALLLLGALGARVTDAQHTHGQATLLIGLEGAAGRIELRAPADDMYGFERAPRTAAERTRQNAALAQLRTGGATLVKFDAALGCRVVADSVGVLQGRGTHAEVYARWQVQCARPVAGRPIGFAISRAFPNVERVSVQLLSDSAQTGRTIVRDRGVVVP